MAASSGVSAEETGTDLAVATSPCWPLTPAVGLAVARRVAAAWGFVMRVGIRRVGADLLWALVQTGSALLSTLRRQHGVAGLLGGTRTPRAAVLGMMAEAAVFFAGDGRG